MLSQADNEFLTRSGKGTPMGELLRRFWMPALLSEELPERDGPPEKIRILGEDLLACRVTDARMGRHDLGLYGPAPFDAGAAAARDGPGAGRAALRLQEMAGLQLGAEPGGRHRHRPRLVPPCRADQE